MNALLGYPRSIVFAEPGTTRDVLTATTALCGWPVELVDTAGLRASSEPIEAEGVARAERQVREAAPGAPRVRCHPRLVERRPRRSQPRGKRW